MKIKDYRIPRIWATPETFAGQQNQQPPPHARHGPTEMLDLALLVADDNHIAHGFGAEIVRADLHDAEIIARKKEIGDLTPSVSGVLAKPHRPVDDLVAESRLVAFVEDHRVAGKADLGPDLLQRPQIVIDRLVHAGRFAERAGKGPNNG